MNQVEITNWLLVLVIFWLIEIWIRLGVVAEQQGKASDSHTVQP